MLPRHPASTLPWPVHPVRLAWLGWRRVCNRWVLMVLLTMALSNAIARLLSATGDPFTADRLLMLAKLMRSTLTSGLCVMVAAGLIEALRAARGDPVARHPRLALATRWLAVAAGAAVGASIRIRLADSPSLPWGWLVANVTVWTLLGGLAVTLLMTRQAEREAHARLLDLRRDQQALEAQELEAQLSALNAQIEPHFLFNTLAHVKRLYETAPADGRNLLGSLITYLQAALPAMRSGEGTLAQELAQVQGYLRILQTRMGDRLRFSVDAPASLADARLPTMVLHTLVENAIKHGLSPLPEGGEIRINARIETPDQWCVEVADTGVGFSASGGSGVGLANTRARLVAMLGPQAVLELEPAQPHGLVARLRLPRGPHLEDVSA